MSDIINNNNEEITETASINLLDEVKTRLLITGDYHDSLLTALIKDVTDYMLSAGITSDIIQDAQAVGCIARGTADLYNFGSGEGKLSDIFKERVIQLAYTTLQSNDLEDNNND